MQCIKYHLVACILFFLSFYLALQLLIVVIVCDRYVSILTILPGMMGSIDGSRISKIIFSGASANCFRNYLKV